MINVQCVVCGVLLSLIIYKSLVESNWSSVRSYGLSRSLTPQSTIFTFLLGTAVLLSEGTSPNVSTTSFFKRKKY